LGNDCSEDNRVNNNGPGNGNGNGNGEDPTECELCLAELSDEQEAALLAALNVGTLAQACALVNIDTVQLLADLTAEGLSIDLITEIFACLDLEIPIIVP
jgi:hypothetical protein